MHQQRLLINKTIYVMIQKLFRRLGTKTHGITGRFMMESCHSVSSLLFWKSFKRWWLVGGASALLRILNDLWGHVILGLLQPHFDPDQVAGQFAEHHAAVAMTTGQRRDQQPGQKRCLMLHRGNGRPRQQTAASPPADLWPRSAVVSVSCSGLIQLPSMLDP